MTGVQWKRLAALRAANASDVKEIQWKTNALLQECLAALGEVQIVTEEAQIAALEEISGSNQVMRLSHREKAPLLQDHMYDILWDEASLPVLRCRGNLLLQNWEAVLAVAFDTLFVDAAGKQGILIRG